MSDYYIRANSESELLEALESIGITDENPTLDQPYALRILGKIPRITDQLDEDGEPIVAWLEGFHANLKTLHPLTDEQKSKLPLIDEPRNKYEVLA